MVADFADKRRKRSVVERRLVVAARAPEMDFGGGIFFGVGERLFGEIRRTRQVGARPVVFENRVRDCLAADSVVRGVNRLGGDFAPEVGLVYLVVAGPKRNRRVRAELADNACNLLLHLLGEVRILRRYAARKGEVLPNENAVLVAKVEEIVVFVDVSAPAANHIAVEVGEHVHRRLDVLFVAVVVGVERHPVRALHENRDIVDVEFKFAFELFEVGFAERRSRAGVLERFARGQLHFGEFEAHRSEARAHFF